MNPYRRIRRKSHNYAMFFIFICILFITVDVDANQDESGAFELNVDRLDDVYRRAAVTALVKARASQILRTAKIPLSDQVLYKQCAKAAKTPVAHAQCVVSLMDASERPESEKSGQQSDSPTVLEKIGSLFRSIFAQPIIPINAESPAIPFNSYDSTKYQKATLNQPLPIAMKEHYYNNDKSGASFYDMGKSTRTFGDYDTLNYNIKPLLRPDGRKKRHLENDSIDPTINRSRTSLEKIEDYHRKMKFVEKIMSDLNHSNSKFINSVSNTPFKFAMRKDGNESVVENVFEAVNALLGDKKSKAKFSLMSPRLFSILPTDQNKRKHLLSPTLFSFHNQDGMFALPDLMKNIDLDEALSQKWLQTFLEVSGGIKALDDVAEQLRPRMEEMDTKIYPAALKLARMQENWEVVSSSYTDEQINNMKEHGYAFLHREQIQMIYNDDHHVKPTVDLDEYSQMSNEQRQRRMDDDIRKLAKLESHLYRVRRQSDHGDYGAGPVVPDDGAHEPTDGHEGEAGGHDEPHIHFHTLTPFAFSSRIANGVALEVTTLSPYAFFSEILMPEALSVQTLGPRAFIPSILSPNALLARILSPAAFRTEILSPRALTAWILTPEAFIFEVLSPKFLELRVLSPEAMIIQVLSPSIIAPRVMSPEAVGVLVLSPNILSPRVLSGHAMLVEVLSPHILGGGHDSHEDEEAHEEHMHKDDENVNLEAILGHKKGNHDHGSAILGQPDHSGAHQSHPHASYDGSPHDDRVPEAYGGPEPASYSPHDNRIPEAYGGPEPAPNGLYNIFHTNRFFF
uniref:Uncharacterized protein n=1 Tax=Panagrellus redivivus TaxID=6233 RepID=A0A7E4V7A2_PANRE